MMSLLRQSDSRDFSPYSSSAEWADEDKTSSSAVSEADVEGPTVAGSACFTGLKKEDMEEGPAVEPSAADMEGPAVAGSAACMVPLYHGGRRSTVEPCVLWGPSGLQAHGFESCPHSECKLGFLTRGNGFLVGGP
ncbi:hypothetical protein E2C01_032984 [Portunus trituberculatus]|uniref:Uncharacterized protein n=1 Tax=Portunus trituberculatus TaxID=210409 RepID=A0A5B7F272_PORTR|nr:hypothetical protein [Portunus trituberculatus]